MSDIQKTFWFFFGVGIIVGVILFVVLPRIS